MAALHVQKYTGNATLTLSRSNTLMWSFLCLPSPLSPAVFCSRPTADHHAAHPVIHAWSFWVLFWQCLCFFFCHILQYPHQLVNKQVALRSVTLLPYFLDAAYTGQSKALRMLLGSGKLTTYMKSFDNIVVSILRAINYKLSLAQQYS